jgi:hypothetical protein
LHVHRFGQSAKAEALHPTLAQQKDRPIQDLIHRQPGTLSSLSLTPDYLGRHETLRALGKASSLK